MDAKASPLFWGCATALITPFCSPGGGSPASGRNPIDREAFVRLLRRQLDAGVDALVIAGTTGESPTLSDAEKEWLFTTAVREARRHAEGRAGSSPEPQPIPIIAGRAGSSPEPQPVPIIAGRAGSSPEPRPIPIIAGRAGAPTEPRPVPIIAGRAGASPEPRPIPIIAGRAGSSPEPQPVPIIAGRAGSSPEPQPVPIIAGRAGAPTEPRPVPIIAGTGSNDTAHAVELARMAAASGCDGLLVVTPYYNKTSEAGLLAHFTAVAEATDKPVILYHVPGRTGCRMTPAVCRALAGHPRIAGLKDAGGDMGFTARVAAACGDALPLYAGCDELTLPTLALGGVGVISVLSNLCPEAMVRLCRLVRAGDLPAARGLARSLQPLMDALAADINPIPIKYALGRRGLASPALRLPLVEAGEAARQELDKALAAGVAGMAASPSGFDA